MRMRHLLKNLSQKRWGGGKTHKERRRLVKFFVLSLTLLGLSLSCSTPSLNPHKPSPSPGIDSSPLGTDEDPSSTIKGWWLYNTNNYGPVALHITDASVNDNADSYLKKFDKAIKCTSSTLESIDTYKYRLFYYEYYEERITLVINNTFYGTNSFYGFHSNANVMPFIGNEPLFNSAATEIIRDPSWKSAEDVCGPTLMALNPVQGWWRYNNPIPNHYQYPFEAVHIVKDSGDFAHNYKGICIPSYTIVSQPTSYRLYLEPDKTGGTNVIKLEIKDDPWTGHYTFDPSNPKRLLLKHDPNNPPELGFDLVRDPGWQSGEEVCNAP